MKKQSAFTLVELLITIGIFSILAGMAVPSFTSFIQTSAMTTNTNKLIGSFHIARSEAIKRGSRVSVCESGNSFDVSPSCSSTGDWKNGWVVWADANSNNVIDSGEELIQVSGEADGTGVTIIGDSNVVNVASFISTGMPENTAGINYTGTFSICDSRGATEVRAVRILASGRIRGTRSLGSC